MAREAASGRVGIARGKGRPGAVDGFLPRPLRREIPLGGELAEEPGKRNLGARRVPLLRGDARHGRPAGQRLREPEPMDEPQDHAGREAVEVLGAQDELRREERPDLRVRDAGEERPQVLGARRHGRILREQPVN